MATLERLSSSQPWVLPIMDTDGDNRVEIQASKPSATVSQSRSSDSSLLNLMRLRSAHPCELPAMEIDDEKPKMRSSQSFPTGIIPKALSTSSASLQRLRSMKPRILPLMDIDDDGKKDIPSSSSSAMLEELRHGQSCQLPNMEIDDGKRPSARKQQDGRLSEQKFQSFSDKPEKSDSNNSDSNVSAISESTYQPSACSIEFDDPEPLRSAARPG